MRLRKHVSRRAADKVDAALLLRARPGAQRDRRMVARVAAAVLNCAYAVPVLWCREDRALGPRRARDRRLAAMAGVLFAIDLVAWHHAIDDVGFGLALVLANVQVVLVPLQSRQTVARRDGAGPGSPSAARG
jgi:hypothetical protein